MDETEEGCVRGVVVLCMGLDPGGWLSIYGWGGMGDFSGLLNGDGCLNGVGGMEW